jgi:hypothetical protein
MKVLELFSGTKSIGKECEKRGWEVWSVDNDARLNPDECTDILAWDYTELHFIPDVLWLSPPCTSWSQASHQHRGWEDLSPLTQCAVVGEALIMKSLEMILYFTDLNPSLVWFLENPRSRLRHFEPMKALPRKTVYYCAFSGISKKPTDIWTNSTTWQPGHPVCKHGKHTRPVSIRAKKFGVIPPLLVCDILDSVQAREEEEEGEEGEEEE